MALGHFLRKIASWGRRGLTWEELKIKLVYAALNTGCAIVTVSLKTTLQTLGNIPLFVAAPVAFIVGGQLNFGLHNFVTFSFRHPTLEGVGQRWRRFVAGNIAGLMLNLAALAGYKLLGAGDTWAFVLALLTSGAFDWLYNKHFAFAKQPLNPPDESSERE